MIITNWDEDIGLYTAVITDTTNNILLTGYGEARCHPDDKQYQSMLTGSFLAEIRAKIDILRKKRDFDLKPGLLALEHLKSTMTLSKHFNPKSYEIKRLYKEIKNKQDEINEVNTVIKELKQIIITYLDEQDRAKTYKK